MGERAGKAAGDGVFFGRRPFLPSRPPRTKEVEDAENEHREEESIQRAPDRLRIAKRSRRARCHLKEGIDDWRRREIMRKREEELETARVTRTTRGHQRSGRVICERKAYRRGREKIGQHQGGKRSTRGAKTGRVTNAMSSRQAI
jgi:hypothetical protein